MRQTEILRSLLYSISLPLVLKFFHPSFTSFLIHKLIHSCCNVNRVLSGIAIQTLEQRTATLVLDLNRNVLPDIQVERDFPQPHRMGHIDDK
jgi:hypothetical protein